VKREIEVRPAAEQELADAVAWYEGEREGLGERLLVAVADALDEIATNPSLGAVWSRDHETRRRILRRFPYVIFYRFTEHAVEVVAIAHAKRRPGYWERK